MRRDAGGRVLFGVPKNNAQSIFWLRRAAEQGSAEAQFTLAASCEFGQRTQKDGGQALSWYRKAAEQGHAAAQWTLGEHYEHGGVVPKDPAHALVWLRRAADHDRHDTYQPMAENELKKLGRNQRGP